MWGEYLLNGYELMGMWIGRLACHQVGDQLAAIRTKMQSVGAVPGRNVGVSDGRYSSDHGEPIGSREGP